MPSTANTKNSQTGSARRKKSAIRSPSQRSARYRSTRRSTASGPRRAGIFAATRPNDAPSPSERHPGAVVLDDLDAKLGHRRVHRPAVLCPLGANGGAELRANPPHHGDPRDRNVSVLRPDGDGARSHLHLVARARGLRGTRRRNVDEQRRQRRRGTDASRGARRSTAGTAVLRVAFSSNPETPKRRASSASRSASEQSRYRIRTSK